MTHIITGKTIAWINHAPDLPTFINLIEKGKNDEACSMVSVSNLNMDVGLEHPWIKIGEVTLHIEVPNEQGMVANAVKSMKEQQRAIMARAKMEHTAIEGQIQKLLAITMSPRAASQRCDGDHGAPECGDPGCWLKED